MLSFGFKAVYLLKVFTKHLQCKPGIVVPNCIPSTWEAEGKGSQVAAQPEVHR